QVPSFARLSLTPRAAAIPNQALRSGRLHLSRQIRLRIAGVAHPAVAVHELLLGPPRGRVQLGRAADLLERSAELCVQLVGAVSFDLEPAATGGSFWTKRRNEDVTARFHGPRYSGDVAPPILRVAQEMEHGPVVPKVVSLCREPDLSDVRDEPPNRGRPIAQARLRGLDSLRRDIEHADVDVPALQEVV